MDRVEVRRRFYCLAAGNYHLGSRAVVVQICETFDVAQLPRMVSEGRQCVVQLLCQFGIHSTILTARHNRCCSIVRDRTAQDSINSMKDNETYL